MSWRGLALRLGAALSLTCGVLVGAGWATSSAAPPPVNPEIAVSPTTVVPGEQMKVTGHDWPARALINVATCGANAIDGTVDCNNSAITTTASLRTGTVTVRVDAAMPPKPCPCVVMAKGVYTGAQASAPVTVEGAGTAPVPPAPGVTQPDFQFQDVHIVSSVTLGSLMGTSTKRTVEFRIHNASPFPDVPVLTGRWGHPTEVHNAITMPYVGEMTPGATKALQATFTLPALSLGAYDVRLTAQVVGFTAKSHGTASTTQWPIGLFVVIALFLLLVLLAIIIRPRRRKRRQAPPAPDHSLGEPVRLASSAESESRSDALSGR